MNLRSFLPPAFLVLCLSAAGVLVVTRGSSTKPPMNGFTVYYNQIAYPFNGAPIVSASKVRRQRSDGSWMLETTYSKDGRVEIGYGEPGRGVFAVDEKNQTLEYLSESHNRTLADTDWSKLPGFAGEEMILGFRTFRIHWEDADGNYTDSYMCPALQGFPLRRVSGNSRYKNVWEPTQVIMGEPVFVPAPNLPVSTKRLEQKKNDLPD